MNTYHSEVLKRPSRLNILQRLLQVLQLRVYLALGLLRALHGLRLKSLDGLDLTADIVLLDLEAAELLLKIIDNSLVLEDGAVVAEVDLLRLLGEDLDLAARVVVALLEVGEGLGGAAFEAKLGAEVGPVHLEGGGTLRDFCVSMLVLYWGLRKLSDGRQHRPAP